MDESEKYFTDWKMPVSKKYALYNSIYIKV